MSAKFWSLVTVLTMGTARLDDEKVEDDQTSESTSDPSPTSDLDPTAYITQNFVGSATVVPGTSYEGSETLIFGINATTGSTDNEVKYVWNIVGSPAESPADCVDCLFAFDLNLTFDADASIDPDGSGEDASFSYALSISSYGEDSIFCRNSGEMESMVVTWRTDLH